MSFETNSATDADYWGSALVVCPDVFIWLQKFYSKITLVTNEQSD